MQEETARYIVYIYIATSYLSFLYRSDLISTRSNIETSFQSLVRTPMRITRPFNKDEITSHRGGNVILSEKFRMKCEPNKKEKKNTRGK